MGLFDKFVRKEKLNCETGKFEVVQEGLNLGGGRNPGEEHDPLNDAIRRFEAKEKSKKSKKSKGLFNSYMNVSERFVKSQGDPNNPMNRMFGVQSNKKSKKKSANQKQNVGYVPWWER